MKVERKIVVHILIVLFVLILLGNLVVLTVLPLSEFTTKVFLSNSLYSVLIGGAMAIGISRISNWLEQKHPWLRNPLKRLVLQLVYTFGFCLLVISLVVLLMILLHSDTTFSDFILESGLFMVKTAVILLTLSLLITYAITFFVNWKKSVIMQEEMKREQLALQYEALKSQVNPHFLFNSLNSVTSLIKSDPDKAILFVKKLSDVFRYVLEQKDNELCPLTDELQFLESYVFLQKIRFGGNLVVNINVDEKGGFVIPLSLQMLVENAIKHNEISKAVPLAISVYLKNNRYIVISNSLKKKPATRTSGLGLANIRSRYGFFTSLPVMVSESGDEFRVEIPVIEKIET